VEPGNAFLGMGAFGRVVRVVGDGRREAALKLIVSQEQRTCERACKEFQKARQAHRTGAVIEVLRCTDVLQSGGRFVCGYTMEVGSPASMKDVGALLKALSTLHCGGWIHGDARVANIVHVARRGLVWVDMTEASQFQKDDGGAFSLLFSDTNRFVSSVYAKKKNISSADVKPTQAVGESVSEYVEAVLCGTDVERSVEKLVQVLERWMD
jgi:tRNA A-37 threonylcarbamoyl transferase component Bud32